MSVKTELDSAWASWLASGLYNTWKTANPNENTKLLGYRAGTQGRPSLVTKFGQALVAETAAWALAGGSPDPPPPPAPQPPVNTAAPAISGLAKEGQTLTASQGTWTGTPVITYAYQWYRCDLGGANCVAIGGATATSYLVQAADVEKRLRVRVTATNAQGTAAVDSSATSTVVDAGGGGIPSGWYWNETFEVGNVPPNWNTTTNSPGSYVEFVQDPAGQRGRVIRLRDDYSSSLPLGFINAALQSASLWRNANDAHSGYLQLNEETWYRSYMMWPANNVFCAGDSNFMQEWHTDDNTQSLGGNSSGIFIQCDQTGSTVRGVNPRIVLVWRSGNPSSPTEKFYPGSGSYPGSGIPVVPNHWYEMLFHVIWSKSAGTGLLEWWVDGVLKVSQTMATLYTNPNNLNSQSYGNYGIYNYRYNASGGTSDAYFDTLLAGPTQASVGA